MRFRCSYLKVEILIESLLLVRGLYLASCQVRRFIPYSFTDILANYLFLLSSVIVGSIGNFVITCSQTPAKWSGIFDHIDFTQVQRITAAALANYNPQSLFIYCKVHSTVSTPLVILLPCIVTAHTYLSILSSCEQVVLHYVIGACSGML